MYSFDPQEWEQHYRRATGPASKHVDRLLDRFQESLRDWLHAALNWPEEDWRTDLARFLDHSRGAGVIVEPDGRAALESLLRSRASGKGLLADRTQGRISKPPFQLAAVEFYNDGQDTDATVDYRAEPTEPELSYELAGSGPETSEAYQRKVKQILAVLDEFVARIWEQKRGIVRSRERNWLQFRYYSEKDDGRLVIVVSPEFTARDTALAILAEAYASGSNRINAEVLEKKLLTAEEIEKQYAELQTKAFKEAAGQAAFLAEFYVSSLASLTPSGELIVNIDDVQRNGFQFEHLLLALPLMAYLRKPIKRLLVVLSSGKKLRLSGKALDLLHKLAPSQRSRLLKKAQSAKSESEAIAVIEQGVAAAEKSQAHHIATNKNWLSTLKGGPWSPKFAELFERAGMNLADAANIVRIPDHRGPHSFEYHDEIYRRLAAATKGKRMPVRRESLVRELQRIAKEVQTKGTKLHGLLYK